MSYTNFAGLVSSKLDIYRAMHHGHTRATAWNAGPSLSRRNAVWYKSKLTLDSYLNFESLWILRIISTYSCTYFDVELFGHKCQID